jgi:hypothetical protein
MCNSGVKVERGDARLQVVDCDGRSVQFAFHRGVSPITKKSLSERKFRFDFRYYEPFHGAGMTMSGLYVFKTSD